MLGTCIIKNYSQLLLFCNSYDWSKYFNTKKHPLKVEFKYISSHELPICRFIHSLCENENIPM